LFRSDSGQIGNNSKVLDNPLVVISKSEQTNRNNIVAIIRKKIIFSSRPKPIVFNLPSV
uniref:Uncharacterized protein n=1 Tax=Parascaris equorum TaxID=6256 RepID=A0A914RBH5_PAREQ